MMDTKQEIDVFDAFDAFKSIGGFETQLAALVDGKKYLLIGNTPSAVEIWTLDDFGWPQRVYIGNLAGAGEHFSDVLLAIFGVALFN